MVQVQTQAIIITAWVLIAPIIVIMFYGSKRTGYWQKRMERDKLGIHSDFLWFFSIIYMAVIYGI